LNACIHAREIYRHKLKDYEIPEISHAFSSDFEYEDFDAAARSELAGRVVCLPYKFENVLPFLKNRYLKKLKEGLASESNLRDRENRGEPVAWESCLKTFVECEYMEKVNEILSRVDWNEYQKKNWHQSLEVSFNSLLNCLSSQNNVEANEWLKKLNNGFSTFGVEKLKLEVMRSPKEISLGFSLSETSHIGASQVIEKVQRLFETCEFKVSLLDKTRSKKIKMVQKKIERFYHYLLPWKTRDISVADYIQLRAPKYPQLIDNFKKKYKKYHTKYSEEQHTKTIMILKEIESKELTEIYGGSRLLIDLQPEN